MKRIVILVIFLLLISAGIFAGRSYIPQLTSSKGAFKIQASPQATIFINGENKGSTPFEEEIDAGTYDVKLLPSDGSKTASWQQQVVVNSGVQTYINANMSNSEQTSSWEIITLEEGEPGETELTVHAIGEPAELTIDAEQKPATPYSEKGIPEGTHDIHLSSNGRVDNTIKVMLKHGYKLKIEAHLAQDSQAEDTTEEDAENTDEATEEDVKGTQDTAEDSSDQTDDSSSEEEEQPTKTPTPKPTKSASEAGTTVTILDTSTGWLRVRSKPSTSGEELGRVSPGDEYELLDEENGWYKINFTEDEEGWIAGQYAQKS